MGISLFFLSFAVVGLAILFGSHYLLYFSLVKFFAIDNTAARIYLFGILFFLAVSFFLVSALAHWKDNFLTQTLYILTGLWLGFLVNFILAVAIGWIIIFIGKIGNFDLNMSWIAASLFLLAVAVSLYGILNAFNPQFKKIEAKINNLPTEWQGKKIIQLSDVHLGHIYKKAFLKKIIREVNAENPDLVVITGDLFDGMDGNLDELVAPLNDIQAKEGIYFVTGNHETYLGLDKAFAALNKTKIRILNDEAVEIKGLQLVGISYPERSEFRNMTAAFAAVKNLQKNKPSILLYHAPTGLEEAAAHGINLQLSGHTHRGQIFPFNFITYLVYSGFDYGFFQLGNFSLYTSSGVGTWGPAMRTSARPEIVEITIR